MKDFESIFIKEKILIVCQVIVGGKIQPIARKHGVSRPFIYVWTEDSFKYSPKGIFKPEQIPHSVK